MSEPYYIVEAITGYWGKRCSEINLACPVCKAWAQYDALATAPAPTVSELDERAMVEARLAAYQLEGRAIQDIVEAAIRAYLAAAPAPTVSGEPVAWLRVRDDGRQTFWDRDVDGFCTPLYAGQKP